MLAIDIVLGWMRCGRATAEEICARTEGMRIRTVRLVLRELVEAGTIVPTSEKRGRSIVYELINDPEVWRSIRWMVGQPQLRVSEYGHLGSVSVGTCVGEVWQCGGKD